MFSLKVNYFKEAGECILWGGGGSRGGWVDRLRGEGWGTRYGGSGLKKNLQILDLQRLAPLKTSVASLLTFIVFFLSLACSYHDT